MKYLKTTCSIAMLTALLLMGNVLNSQAQNFEGIIYYQFAEMEQSGMDELEYMIKDENIRIQFGEGQHQGAMIFLPESSKMLFVLENMKSYMAIDMSEWADQEVAEEEWQESDYQKTGETKEIAGYTCEVWEIQNQEGDELTMCMAEGMGTFMTPGNPMARQNAPEWAKKISSEGFMPLEVIEKSANGESITQLRANRIEEQALESSLFKAPNDYKDMSSMMEQMMKQNN